MNRTELAEAVEDLLYIAGDSGHEDIYMVRINYHTVFEAFLPVLQPPYPEVFVGTLQGVKMESFYPEEEDIPDSVMMYLISECYPNIGMDKRGLIIAYYD